MGAPPLAAALEGAGVRFTRDNDTRWRLEVTDLSGLRAHLGDELLVAFARAFAVADRMLSIHHLMWLLRDVDLQSVRRQRDTGTLILFAWATIRESCDVVDALALADVESNLSSDHTSWDSLRAIRARWRGSGLQSDVRNRIVSHFDAKLVRDGIDRLCAEPGTVPLNIAWGDGKGELYMGFPIGLQFAMAGLGQDEQEVIEFAVARKQDQFEYAERVQQLFVDVLEKRMAKSASASPGRA